MSRLSGMTRDEMTEEQQREFDAVAPARGTRPDGTLGGLFDAWLLSPEFFHRMRGMGLFLWERTSLDRGIVELAILITARCWRAGHEWVAHAPRAVEYGIGQDVLDAVLAEQRPEGAPDSQLLLYDICMALHDTRELPLDLYERGVETFGAQGLVEIVGVIGFYTTCSMTFTAFGIGLDPGETPPF